MIGSAKITRDHNRVFFLGHYERLTRITRVHPSGSFLNHGFSLPCLGSSSLNLRVQNLFSFFSGFDRPQCEHKWDWDSNPGFCAQGGKFNRFFHALQPFLMLTLKGKANFQNRLIRSNFVEAECCSFSKSFYEFQAWLYRATFMIQATQKRKQKGCLRKWNSKPRDLLLTGNINLDLSAFGRQGQWRQRWQRWLQHSSRPWVWNPLNTGD